MKKEVDGIKLLELLKKDKIEVITDKIIRKKTNEVFIWNSKNLVSEDEEKYYSDIYNDSTFINDIFIIDIKIEADDLLEKLGFIKKVEDDSIVQYNNECSIIFNKENKTYRKSYIQEITIKEHIAIHKKMEELGWLQ